MVVKLNSLSRWIWLKDKDTIEFRGVEEQERLVRVQFNLEKETTFYLSQYGVEDHLITLPAGVETVEFYIEGNFSIFAAEGAGGIAYQSSDYEPTFSEVVDPVIFTKIANRRQRNPELEEIARSMQLNTERRIADLKHDMDLQVAAIRRENENVRSNNEGQNPAASAGGEQQKVAGAEKSGSGAGGDNGSQQQGGDGAGQAGDNKPA